MAQWHLALFLLYGAFVISVMLALVFDLHVKTEKWLEKKKMNR